MNQSWSTGPELFSFRGRSFISKSHGPFYARITMIIERPGELTIIYEEKHRFGDPGKSLKQKGNSANWSTIASISHRRWCFLLLARQKGPFSQGVSRYRRDGWGRLHLFFISLSPFFFLGGNTEFFPPPLFFLFFFKFANVRLLRAWGVVDLAGRRNRSERNAEGKQRPF